MPPDVRTAAWSRRHPHQVLIASMCLLSGLAILIGGPRPGSISSTLPLGFLYVWAVTLTFGGAIIVMAALVRSVVTALYLELVADLPVAIAALVYAVAVVYTAGGLGLVSAALVSGASAAFLTRFVQALRTVRALRRDLESRTHP